MSSFVMFLITENRLPLVSTRVHTLGVESLMEAVKVMICGGRNAAARYRKPLVNNPTAKTSNISHPLCRTSGLKRVTRIADNRRALSCSCKHSMNNVITAGDLYGKLLLDN